MIFIDYHSRMPIYEQIKEQIIMLINAGVYKPDDQLPSIRALSKELNINVNTTKRAFSELERDGVVYSARGRGVFVAPNPTGNEKIKASALDDVRNIIHYAAARGVKKDEIISLLDEIYKVGDNND